MSKVTIRFWNNTRKQYEDKWGYFVGEDGVYECVGSDYYGDACIQKIEYIEPHFFVNGERIA